MSCQFASHTPQQTQQRALPPPMSQRMSHQSFDPSDDGKPFPSYEAFEKRKHPNIPLKSFASTDDKGVRTNLGNTKLIMALLSEMWIVNLIFIMGCTFIGVFYIPQGYIVRIILIAG